MYSHFVKKSIPDKVLIEAFLIVIKWTGCYQTRCCRWELLPENRQQVWVDIQFWWKKEYLQVKPTLSACQTGYGMAVAEEQQAAEKP